MYVRTALLLPPLPLLLLQAFCSEAQGVSGNRRRCFEMPEEVLEQRFGQLSVGILSAFHHTLQLLPEPHNLSCPSASRPQPDRSSRSPVNLRSISPWSYRMNHDPARYPRFIPEAYCLCKGCLTGPGGEESEDHRSVPVFVPTAVLRRAGSCVGGRHSYTESYESVPVGCTCVPTLKRSSKQSSDRGPRKPSKRKNIKSELQ